MRSNGATHIGNDTFLAATRDVTDGLFLFSSSFPTEEQLAALPLARHVRFHPHADLACSPAELEHYSAAAAREFRRSTPASPTSPNTKSRGDTESSAALAAPLFRHSLHASPDGQQIAVISNVLRHHYVIDIAAEPAAVCALEMPELVRSVCWHPVTSHVLYVLFISGDVMIYDTSRTRIGVILPRHRRLALRPVIQRCLAEAEGSGAVAAAVDASSSTTAPGGVKSATFAKAIATFVAENNKASSGNKKVAAGQSTKETKSAAATAGGAFTEAYVSPSVYSPANAEANGAEASAASVAGSGSIRGIPSPSPTANTAPSKLRPLVDPKAFDEIIPADKEPGSENTTTTVTSAPDALHRRTAQTDLVDLFILPPTVSLPVILLLLSSSGDVYAVHLSEADALPVPPTAAAVDDGRVRTFEEERRRLAENAAATSVSAEVHHLIAGDLTANWDEALSVRGCCLDPDAGTHAVFYVTAAGHVRGAWVSEPDLLARHRTAHLRTHGGSNIAFAVELDGRGSTVRADLSPAVPTTTHTVTMTQSDNVCLLRCGAAGEAAYVLAMPCWDRQRHGWAAWLPSGESAAETTALRHALPLLSCDDAVPAPVALRLPYDTRGASVALGVQEILLVPELSSQHAGSCDRHRIFSITLLSLLRSALYARCGTLQLHPASNHPKAATTASAATTKAAASSSPFAAKQGALMPSTMASAASEAASSRVALQRLVNLIPVCHRRWLCGAPSAEVDAVTVELATLVERQTRQVEQRERMQAQRRERLMARVAALEGRMSEMNAAYDRWQQTLLDAIVHRRGSAAVRTANERLGEVHTMLNEWEHQH